MHDEVTFYFVKDQPRKINILHGARKESAMKRLLKYLEIGTEALFDRKMTKANSKILLETKNCMLLLIPGGLDSTGLGIAYRIIHSRISPPPPTPMCRATSRFTLRPVVMVRYPQF